MKMTNSHKFNSIIPVSDDGLTISEVRSWSEQKYQLVGIYCDVFTKGMHKKWDNLVYIDLFAGCGYSRIKNTSKTILSSPLIAMSIPIPFTHYIFCEKEKELIEALQIRQRRDFAHLTSTFIHGDCNEKIGEIVDAIPAYSKSNLVLGFCFADPFSLNLHFATIEQLSNRQMDFLILLALHMDGNRNFQTYIKEDNSKLNLFFGNDSWRSGLIRQSATYETFVPFLAENYTKRMVELNYQKPQDFTLIRSDVKNLPLYYLAFYSKHARGNEFWKKIKKYANGQQEMDLN